MIDLAPLDLPRDGKLVQNITHFARALRKAGLPLGTQRLIDAIRAVQTAGFTRRDDFYWTLHACFVSRPEHRLLFDQMFRLYWRDPKYIEHMMALLTPIMRGLQDDRRAKPAEKRAAEALLDGVERPVPDLPDDTDAIIEIDASQTMSETERLRTLDFEQMSVADMAAARRMIARLRLPVRPLLRWDGFAPMARGIALMLPHVTSFRAGHNIASLEALGAAISRPDDSGEKLRLMRLIGRQSAFGVDVIAYQRAGTQLLFIRSTHCSSALALAPQRKFR